MRFEPTELTTDELALQAEVRDFLASELPRGGFEPGLGMGAHRDPAFSKALAARGWVGMALPARYGGKDRSASGGARRSATTGSPTARAGR
jgi:alkylation response protein AidB-like acyl-CoA dehydrogenase